MSPSRLSCRVAVIRTLLCLAFYIGQDEAKLIDSLRRYIEIESAQPITFQNFKNVSQVHRMEEELARNPLAIYQRIRFFAADFGDVKANDGFVARTPGRTRREISLGDINDRLYDETRYLVQLQRAYNLSVADMMDGRLHSNVTLISPILKAEDCFQIATSSAAKYDHETATEWLQGCEGRFDKRTQDHATKIVISSSLFTGNKPLTSKVLNDVLREDMSDSVLIDLDLKLTAEDGNWTERKISHYESVKACSADYKSMNSTRMKNMKCRYNHHNSPFLKIAPLKEEILSLEPKVSLFREVVHDSEIEFLKTETSNRFRTCSTRRTGVSMVEPRYRPCEVAFIANHRLEVNLRNRLSDMASLSMKFSEPLQTVHYGPGGYYRVHADFLSNCVPKPWCEVTGNRVATILMYLNDVPMGGNTVFPHLKLSIQPVKGSALFWIDMTLNRSQEVMTQHAACPVIYGEKMAGTHWFRMNGQDHWFAEPEDDVVANYAANPNVVCSKRLLA